MREALAVDQSPYRMAGTGLAALSQLIRQRFRVASCREGAECLAIAKQQAAVGGTAKGVGLLQNRVEDRGEVAGRRIDDLQYLGGCGLLFERLTRLVDEPRILHRDDRLRREVLQQPDLLVGEWENFFAMHYDRPEQR